jgi:hypothetical protein
MPSSKTNSILYWFRVVCTRDVALRRAFSRRAVLLTTYGMALHNTKALMERPRGSRADAEEDEEAPLWDFMFTDEVWRRLGGEAPVLACHLRCFDFPSAIAVGRSPINHNRTQLDTDCAPLATTIGRNSCCFGDHTLLPNVHVSYGHETHRREHGVCVTGVSITPAQTAWRKAHADTACVAGLRLSVCVQEAAGGCR